MLYIANGIFIEEGEIKEEFIRSSGPGGQNVNKVATAVQLRFDAARSRSLPERIRVRLLQLAGSRATAEGVVIIEARRFRSQEQNRRDARERLLHLLRKAAVEPKRRQPTRPSRAARERRLLLKKQRSAIKRLRRGRDQSE